MPDDKDNKIDTLNSDNLKNRIFEFRQIINSKYCEYDNFDIDSDNSELKTSLSWKKPLNASDAIEKLAEAESLLLKEKEDVSNLIKAEKLFYEARHAWHKAIISANSNKFGYAVVVIELLYLLGVFIGYYFLYKYLPVPISHDFYESRMVKSTFLQVPVVVYIWGFIGGATWCAYSACFWMKRRMFDSAYLIWYIAHPFVSSFLGAIAAVLVLGGVETFSKSEDLSKPSINLLILISFIAGFSANNIWKTIDKYVRKTFGDKLNVKNKIL